MEKLKFVDVNFHQLPETAGKSARFAIDLGVKDGYERRTHCFVSAAPWLKNVTRGEVSDFQRELEKLNPDVCFELLSLEDIGYLNIKGRYSDFKILNCWTSNQDCDYFGAYGCYMVKNGAKLSDPGTGKTDVYFMFWVIPGREKNIVMP